MEDLGEDGRLDPSVRAIDDLLRHLRSEHRATFAGLWRNADSGAITVALTHDAEAAARELERRFPAVGPLVGVHARCTEAYLRAVRDQARQVLDDAPFTWVSLALDVVTGRVELGVPTPSACSWELERRFAPDLIVVAEQVSWAPTCHPGGGAGG